MALRFFSRLPTGNAPHEKPALGRIAVALPVASLIMGLGPALLLVTGCWAGLPAYFAVTLAMAVSVPISGAMAEDAIADSVDGLFGGHTVARRLEIMKDSRHGTYGVVAIGLFLLLRIFAVGSVAIASPLAAAGIWLAGSVVARSSAIWLALRLGPARMDGASATVGQSSPRQFAIGLAGATVIAIALAAPFASALGIALAAGFAALVTYGWTALCRRLVGGQTGDLIGGLMALIEVAVLTGLLIAF